MTPVRLPFYTRLAYVLISISLIVVLIFVGQHIIIPIALSLLFAILLRPWVHFLSKRLKFPHTIAVLTAIILAILIVIGIFIFITWQVENIAGEWEKIQNNFMIYYHKIQAWIFNGFGISYSQQDKYIQDVTQNSTAEKKELMGDTLSSISGVLFNFILIPFYTFLFLLYRNLFIKFLLKLFGKEHHQRLQEILFEIKFAVQSYLVGLLIEMIIVSTLTGIGLMIIGVPYAILLGVITGILNLVPYIGIMFAALLSILATFTGTADFSIIIGVLAVNGIVQIIDNNLLVPMIVSSKVKINALFTIVGIVVGGALAGIAGMFLAIPLIAILKVIFDRIDSLEPWGYLMGDDLPKTIEWLDIKSNAPVNLKQIDTETQNAKPLQ